MCQLHKTIFLILDIPSTWGCASQTPWVGSYNFTWGWALIWLYKGNWAKSRRWASLSSMPEEGETRHSIESGRSFVRLQYSITTLKWEIQTDNQTHVRAPPVATMHTEWFADFTQPFLQPHNHTSAHNMSTTEPHQLYWAVALFPGSCPACRTIQ